MRFLPYQLAINSNYLEYLLIHSSNVPLGKDVNFNLSYIFTSTYIILSRKSSALFLVSIASMVFKMPQRIKNEPTT